MNLDKLYEVALGSASKFGASYADIRLCITKDEKIHAREQKVKEQLFSFSQGFGIRVIVGGAWGFSASSVISEDSIKKSAKQACEMARAANLKLKGPVQLASTPAWRDSWSTPIVRDPFLVPLKERTDFSLI